MAACLWENSELTVPGIQRPAGASYNVCDVIGEKRAEKTDGGQCETGTAKVLRPSHTFPAPVSIK